MGRRLTVIAVSLLIGGILTAAVAWLLPAASVLRTIPVRASGWPPGTPSQWTVHPDTILRVGPGIRLIECTGIEAIDDSLRGLGSPLQLELNASVLEIGWPCPAFRARQWAEGLAGGGRRMPVGLSVSTAGVRAPWTGLPQGALQEPRLPVLPILPGLALDVAFFAGVVWTLGRGPRAVRWALRRRCGLCTGCGYPAGATICPECGGSVRPWEPSGQRPALVSSRALRLAAIAMGSAVVLAALLYLASGRWGLYLKGPRGWFGAVWHGEASLGRASRPFERFGVEVHRYGGPLSLGPQWQSQLVGRIVGIPLWLPVPGLIAIGVAGWWREAVRRGLARHWPPPVSANPSKPPETSMSEPAGRPG